MNLYTLTSAGLPLDEGCARMTTTSSSVVIVPRAAAGSVVVFHVKHDS